MAVRIRVRIKPCLVYLFLTTVMYVVLMSYLITWTTTSSAQSLPKHSAEISNKGNYLLRFPFRRTNLNRTLKVLLWTPWFGDPKWAESDLSSVFSKCPVSDCVLTKKKSDVANADAVLFHAMDLWNKFLGYENPKVRKNEQVYIYSNHEPPGNLPVDFKKYSGFFNWTFSYRRDSDIYLPYVSFDEVYKEKAVPDVASTKSAGIAWVASNCGDEARRQLLVKEIQKYIQVDTYGFCGEKSLPNEATNDVLKKYKFYLSFESSFCRDYITEKFTRPLFLNTLPVVSGGGEYKTVAPPHSYIDVRDFNNVSELVTYLKYLDSNDTAYNRYFEWTNRYTVQDVPSRWCLLCEALHDESRVYQVYTDMDAYVSDDTCQTWTLSRYLSRMARGYAVRLGIL